MKKIQYLEIIKQAFLMNWRNKFLWVLGFFVLIGSASQVFDFKSQPTKQDAASQFMVNHPWLSAGLILVAIVVFIALFILRIVGLASIIKATNDINVYRQSKIKAIIKETKKSVAKLLLLEILIAISLAMVVALLLIPVSYMFLVGAKILGSVFLIIAVLIIIPLIILAYFLRRYAFIFLSLSENMHLKLAIEKAYSLLEKTPKQSLMMGIISLVSAIGVIAVAFAGIVIVGLCTILLGIVAFLLATKIGAVVVGIIGAILTVVFLILLFSWYQAFVQTMWVLFFQQINYEKKDEKKEKEAVSVEVVPSPEAV